MSSQSRSISARFVWLFFCPHFCFFCIFYDFLSFSPSNLKKLKWSTRDLVLNADEFSNSLGFETSPALEKKTAGKMGLAVRIVLVVVSVVLAVVSNV